MQESDELDHTDARTSPRANVRDFYATSRGKLAAAEISLDLSKLKLPAGKRNVLAVGPCDAYLHHFDDGDSLLIRLTSDANKAPGTPTITPVVGSCTDFPIADQTIDLVLMIHTLESAPDQPKLLREVWRLLLPEGHLVAIVPRPAAQFSLAGQTPFGLAPKFRTGELNQLLAQNLFVPQATIYSLLWPPFDNELLRNALAKGKVLAPKLASQFSSAMISLSQKQIHRPAMVKQATMRTRARSQVS